MSESFGPIDGRLLLCQIKRPRSADQVILRSVSREHRTHLVLLAVKPGDEQHLHRTAAIPVALFEVRSNAADTGAKALRDHGRVTRIALSCDCELPLRS